MNMPSPRRVLVVGARSVRQGTGPFIAAGLAAAGADICGIVGTSEASVSDALAGLADNWQISTRGFTDLGQALEQLKPDAVALCSPWRCHADQLAQVAAAGCHCLVEKPMVWPATREQADALVAAYENQGLLLQMVGQWPATLAAFAKLHGGLPGDIERFAMRLSPISIGRDMVTDSAPHFISMLQALAGPGDCERCALTVAPGGQQLELDCQYRHGRGSISARLLLETCEQRPRPAWYAINGARADREVTLPEYRQSLAGAGSRVAFADPMHQVTADFLAGLARGRTTDGVSLRSAHRNLLQLAAVWR
ncbi:Gfo/Idh/MocA family protein [Seongchinamella sediminis]|nr:Gfo/Idh/MocA family oxidoreductase [Seongchinamella sediminis]